MGQEYNMDSQLWGLGVSALISLLVLRHYRHARYDPPQMYSTFWPRFWTGSVDSFVLWPLGFVISLLLTYGLSPVAAPFLVVFEQLIFLLYVVVMHGHYGQTVGKMACKVRVIDNRTGGKITFWQAWLRESIPVGLNLVFLVHELTYSISGKAGSPLRTDAGELSPTPLFWLCTLIPPLWFLAEIVTMLTNSRRRALHDFIAGTIVVRTSIREVVPVANSARREM